jgi:hypothetical protein
MRTATSLTLIAIGAILAFAVTASPSFLNLQVAGLVIIATGLAGLFIPRRGHGWLRRRVVRRPGTRAPLVERIDETRTPSYVMLNPAVLDSVQSDPEPVDEVTSVIVDDVAPEPDLDEPAPDQVPEQANRGDRPRAAHTEIVEEFFNE